MIVEEFFCRPPDGCLFVPLRSMQFLSALDAEVMRRGPGEFHKALREGEQKTVLPGLARVMKLTGGNC
jgi:hypothetical protein